MLLFFDTETTGFYDFQATADDPKQPHLVQLAAMLTEDDGKEINSISCIVAPNEFEIPTGASDVHGITTERAREVGVNIRPVLSIFGYMASVSDRLVAHNVDFDAAILKTEFMRQNSKFSMDLCAPFFCTMKASTNICKISFDKPRASLYAGMQQYKWPKLQEAYKFFFNEEFEGAHDALADVRACKRIYFHLLEKGLVI
jgi:DNA polymerase-3 subunit epsilon